MKRIALALAFASACNAPPLEPSADHVNDPPLGIIRGDVVYTGPSRGNAVLLLYNALQLPPPRGSGRPVNFAIVDQSTLFGSGTGTGPFTAPFTFGPVQADQSYLVAAFLDVDQCAATPTPPACHGPDFVPWYSVTNQPNAGDVLGGHVDIATTAFLPVTVPVVNGLGGVADQVSVIIQSSAATTEPVDRPSFVITTNNTDVTAGAMLTLAVHPISADPVFESGPFLLRYVDDNGDGIPDLGPSGQPLFWPRVLVRKLDARDPTGLHDENDLDADGVVDIADAATAAKYPYLGTDPNPALPPAAILQAGVVPTAAEVAGLANPVTGAPDVTRFVPVTSLTLAVLPVALDIKVPTEPAPLQSPPPGHYGVTIENFTGQTWRLPNELEQCPTAPTCPDLLPTDATQGTFLSVVSP